MKYDSLKNNIAPMNNSWFTPIKYLNNTTNIIKNSKMIQYNTISFLQHHKHKNLNYEHIISESC